jgi:hypothetical protein
MQTEYLDRMPAIGFAFDTETWLSKPKFVPPLVCASVSSLALKGRLLDKAEAREEFIRLMNPGPIIVTANGAFDMFVMAHDLAREGHDPVEILELIFGKYDRGEVYDILIGEALDAIARGCLGIDPRTGQKLRNAEGKQTGYYSLYSVCDTTFNYQGSKDADAWRKSYALLDGVPLDQWPADARKYPVDDSNHTLIAALVQCGHLGRDAGIAGLRTAERRRANNLHAMADIARAAFALHLGSCWGFGIDQEAVEALAGKIEPAIAAGAKAFEAVGLIRGPDDKKAGTKDLAALKKRVVEAYGVGKLAPCPYCESTMPGKVLSPKSGKPINDPACNGTGYDLEAIGPVLPRTDKDGVTTARDVLIDSGDDVLYEFGEWGELAKTISTYVPALRNGLPLFPNVPLVNERVSYAGIVQTMPRKGAVRDCVVARPGTVLSSVDFGQVELCTLGQVCIWLLGHSKLADVMNSGADPHAVLGADLCGRTYDEFTALLKGGDKQLADYRQAAKWGNFGFGGMMGPPKFVITNRRAPGMTTKAPGGKVYKGVRFCLLIGGRPVCGEEKITEWYDRPQSPVCKACVESAITIREAWFGRWTEMKAYFDFIKHQVEDHGTITHFVSGVVRQVDTVTQAANGYFSALAAVGAKRAFYAVTRECYLARPGDALYGSRPIGFIHDESVCEHPEDRAHAAAMRVTEIMLEEMQKVTPDVKIKAEPAIMKKLYKGASPVFDGAGNLIPWEPDDS